jgi:hypothetical protein
MKPRDGIRDWHGASSRQLHRDIESQAQDLRSQVQSLLRRVSNRFTACIFGGVDALLTITLIVLLQAGCTLYRTGPPHLTSTVALLAWLQPGKTTRQEVTQEWGPPAASLQEGRILFYRLEGTDNRLRFSEEAGRWDQSRQSLVLIFNPAAVLDKSSLVRIR